LQKHFQHGVVSGTEGNCRGTIEPLYKAIEKAQGEAAQTSREQALKLAYAALEEFRKHHARQEMIRRFFQALHINLG